MKYETLIKRYVNIGYIQKGLDQYLEVESIIKWLYDNFDIYICTSYCSMDFKDGNFKKFCGYQISKVRGKDNHDFTYHCNNKFTSPFDAKFDGLVQCYGGLKFSHFMLGKKVNGIYIRDDKVENKNKK
jgi:hypothetical protein